MPATGIHLLILGVRGIGDFQLIIASICSILDSIFCQICPFVPLAGKLCSPSCKFPWSFGSTGRISLLQLAGFAIRSLQLLPLYLGFYPQYSIQWVFRDVSMKNIYENFIYLIPKWPQFGSFPEYVYMITYVRSTASPAFVTVCWTHYVWFTLEFPPCVWAGYQMCFSSDYLPILPWYLLLHLSLPSVF